MSAQSQSQPSSNPGPMRVLVVDDEPLARRGLRLRLAKHADVVVVAEAGNGISALEAVNREQPDLMFLDVQMPGLDGFGTLEKLPLGQAPITIFVTAYDQYAVQAFEARALDYLLKPVEDDRLEQALERARARFRERTAEVHCERLLGLLADWSGNSDLSLEDALEEEIKPPAAEQTLTVKDGHKVLRIPHGEIRWIDAAGDYLCIHAGGETLVVRGTMKDMEARLDSQRFPRVHRSTLVAAERVRELRPHLNGEYFLVLDCGQVLKLSRSYREQLALFSV